MILQPKCYKRNCKHFTGIKSEGIEINERPVCKAFPNGIPPEIAYGENLHLKPLRNQKNDIVYEQAKP